MRLCKGFPSQKLSIVEALKKNREIVAMTGDGVNDAPALKAAHIGIAMGKRGSDVAREASSLVLTDDDFGSIVNAIMHGRRIFSNLQKAMLYTIAIHLPIVGLSFADFVWSAVGAGAYTYSFFGACHRPYVFGCVRVYKGG